MKKNWRLLNYSLLISFVLLALTYSCKKDDDNNQVKDIDGNVYQTITIGSQIWMRENLKTTRYRNGDSIPNITYDSVWINTTSGAYCNYVNDVSQVSINGYLYNWYAINDSRKICPIGWHIPSDSEWNVLQDYLILNYNNFDGTTTGNKIAKSLASETKWEYADYEGVPGSTDHQDYINKSGFTAFPSGLRDNAGKYGYSGEIAVFWSSTQNDPINAWQRYLKFYNIDLNQHLDNKIMGCSVRCIKD